MAKKSLAVCLLIFAALGVVYGQGTTFKFIDSSPFPKMSKDFLPYAYKGISDLVNELEGNCLATTEFKNLFAKLRDYIDFCFKSASPRSIDFPVEMSEKAQQVSMAMSALTGAKDRASKNYWGMIFGLVSMEKVVVVMKMKSNSTDLITSDQQNKLFDSILEWIANIVIFVKEVSEMRGKTIEVQLYGVTSDGFGLGEYLNRMGLNKTKEPFSLPLYLQNSFPKMRKDFEPFAYKGMLDFVADLESQCIASAEFKEFFVRLNSYMDGFKSVSPDSYSIPTNNNMMFRTEILFVTIAALNGTKGETLDPWKFIDGLLTMGEVLVEMKRSDPKDITFEQKRDLTWSMVKWARGVSLFVKTASEKKGVTIDTSSFDKYYDSNVLVPSKGAGSHTGRDHPSGRNDSKGTSASNSSNSTKLN